MYLQMGKSNLKSNQKVETNSTLLVGGAQTKADQKQKAKKSQEQKRHPISKKVS